MKKFVDLLNEPHDVDNNMKVAAFGEITLPMEVEDRYLRRQAIKHNRDLIKEASGVSYIIPTALGLGAAGTAGYIGLKDATSRAKLKAARKIKDRATRERADREIDAAQYSRMAPAALGAGLGAMYLTGTSAKEKNVKSKKSVKKVMKNWSTKKKILRAPGLTFQRVLKGMGATSAQGKGIAGALTLGAGALAGKYMGDKVGDEAIQRATGKGMPKSAGLFLKPSDLASNHHDLSAALENKLNAVDDARQFKKQANTSKSMAAGAALGLVYEPVRQVLSKPVPTPKPQKPRGTVDRVRQSLARSRYEHDKWSREHPVTATLLSGSIGAGVGAATKFGTGFSELRKTFKGKT